MLILSNHCTMKYPRSCKCHIAMAPSECNYYTGIANRMLFKQLNTYNALYQKCLTHQSAIYFAKWPRTAYSSSVQGRMRKWININWYNYMMRNRFDHEAGRGYQHARYQCVSYILVICVKYGGLTHWGERQHARHFPDKFKCIFVNENIWIFIEMSLKFVTSHYLNQWWLDYWHIYASLELNASIFW